MATAWPVVLDSCVLFNACLRDTLLRAAAADLFRPQWSDRILDDTTRNLVASGKTTAEQASKLEATIRMAFPEAVVDVPEPLISAMVNHEGDRHVTAAAIVARAPVIVTANLKHFLPEHLQPYGIEAQAPDTFLVHLYDLAPSRMVQIVAEQARALRRPSRTPGEILAALRASAPGFVEFVEQHSLSPGVPAGSKPST